MILRPETTQASSAELLKLSPSSYKCGKREKTCNLYKSRDENCRRIMVTRRNFARNITRNYTVFSCPPVHTLLLLKQHRSMLKREDGGGRIGVLINVQYAISRSVVSAMEFIFYAQFFTTSLERANRKQYPVGSKIIDPNRNINVLRCLDIVLKSPKYTTRRVTRLVDI